MHSSVVLAVFF